MLGVVSLSWVGSSRKRMLDLVLATLGLAVLWPILLIVAAVVKLQDGAAVFFRQDRVGRGGRLFRIWKFRTMFPGADKRDRGITVAGDSRVTRVGAWLRTYKVDELPQLFNVLRGEMSLVGPRPEVPRYVDTADPRWRAVLTIRPGTTGLDSLTYRHEQHVLAASEDPELKYRAVILPEKLALNLRYARASSFWLDARVILLTVASSICPSCCSPDFVKRSLLGGEAP
jgi:lipopolysaccharide/colanic/teichoic acid biosynthesis glycosyltransferase